MTSLVQQKENKIVLNEEQRTVYNALDVFLSSGPCGMFLLEGYAGTGKTTVLSEFIRDHLQANQGVSIAMTAPTNKAVKVLRTMFRRSGRQVEFITIHKLLALRETIMDDGTQLFVRSSHVRPKIDHYQVVVVDEVSMLDDKLFKDLHDHAGRVKLIFMGDPAQVPPVNHIDCIPFRDQERKKYSIARFTLSKIMRQKDGNPIIEASFRIRKSLNMDQRINPREDILVDGHGLEFIDGIKMPQMKELLTKYFGSDKYRDDPDYCKVICWRNVIIKFMNDLIREILYGKDIDKIVIGERLVANAPIMEGDSCLFHTNDEFEVVGIELGTKEVNKQHFKCYYADVEYFDVDAIKKEIQTICIIHEESEKAFGKMLNDIKKDALSSPSPRKVWKFFYDMKGEFANVGYAYGISVHKSQGSTYKNVIMLESDIDRNHKIVERNRIKYTAITRASDKVYVVTGSV